VKEKCGLLGVGAKVSLDYTFTPTAGVRTFPVNRSQTPRPCSAVQLRSRNLDGEGSFVINPKIEYESPVKQENPNARAFYLNKEKIGSIQKVFQKRNAFDVDSTLPQKAEILQVDEDVKSVRSTTSSSRRLKV
jgi:hypothetical protein